MGLVEWKLSFVKDRIASTVDSLFYQIHRHNDIVTTQKVFYSVLILLDFNETVFQHFFFISFFLLHVHLFGPCPKFFPTDTARHTERQHRVPCSPSAWLFSEHFPRHSLHSSTHQIQKLKFNNFPCDGFRRRTRKSVCTCHYDREKRTLIDLLYFSGNLVVRSITKKTKNSTFTLRLCMLGKQEKPLRSLLFWTLCNTTLVALDRTLHELHNQWFTIRRNDSTKSQFCLANKFSQHFFLALLCDELNFHLHFVTFVENSLKHKRELIKVTKLIRLHTNPSSIHRSSRLF